MGGVSWRSGGLIGRGGKRGWGAGIVRLGRWLRFEAFPFGGGGPGTGGGDAFVTQGPFRPPAMGGTPIAAGGVVFVAINKFPGMLAGQQIGFLHGDVAADAFNGFEKGVVVNPVVFRPGGNEALLLNDFPPVEQIHIGHSPPGGAPDPG